ncbi:phiSA1p31-related protein [Streptomyces formicae]|uniref:PhiSA1p31-related protein n=1 Tax=Streptomyces formicae TaxID=1616117 RepID=A0ABY3WQG3_9ACTN|nr:phiSA1p31-related protein [Streptomyces formicae]UNM13826.1 phiSA1p31-related protein [Streptomyces formicae]
MSTFVHDGVEFDLDRTYVDVVGVEWRWTGQRNEHGEPLMTGGGENIAVPLPDVYHDHGPLIPVAAARLSSYVLRDALLGPVVA